MKTLLHIDSSPRAVRSHSRQLTARFVDAWRDANRGGRVIHREVGLTPLPLVSEDWIAAAFSNPADRTPAQRAAIAVSDELIDELLVADEVVIGAPMHNFSVTASLKAWIDQVVRVGRTVDYPSYAGLVTGKKVTIIVTRGLSNLSPGEPMAHSDAQAPYLRLVLGFIGITDVTIVYAGGLTGSDATRQSSLHRALTEIEALATK
ncbi:NAD(P)H-dependent oxidoreductase [uncultured Paludibaculum sp.]|uniref:FMN-dependent NADH-azoreductase n=1 Tax=uncultured Paludibaculum sp. TaxID=1765020 RepID=UPI002AABC3D3|nr:NAD(P)H-dependent oxidoreductase [uncultured Paludibaculum sp.]